VTSPSFTAVADPADVALVPTLTRPATGPRELDEMVARLREGAVTFARLSIRERIALARSMQAGYLRIAERSVLAGCRAKGIMPGTPLEGEEWVGPWCVVRHLRLIGESLEAIERTGNTRVGRVDRTADGRLAVQVVPGNAVDGVLFRGITVDVHMQEGVTEQSMTAARAGYYRRGAPEERVVLVLGAGNLAMIPVMDVVTKLFNEGKVCLLKMNPVNAYLGPLLEEAFGSAIAAGFLTVAYGGVDEGAYLVQHQGVDEIHLTGSDRTYDTLVWGPPGPERDRRRERGAPLIYKPITAELGNVSPVLVVPGPYTDRELAFQAEAITGSVTYNASFNCNSTRMIVTPRGWRGRAAMLAGIDRVLAATPGRRAYYPGADQRWRALTRGRANTHLIGTAGEGQLPWTLLPGLDATSTSEPAFTSEHFCPVLGETEVGSDDPVEYLERAVDFANDRLWGTLSATVVVHPSTLKDTRLGPAVERAIGRLRYGAVAVNAWSGMLFSFASPPWGAYPGATLANIQSGTGWVHNTPMLEGIEKVVLRHPVTIMPKPASFPSHRTVHVMMRKLTALEERSSWARVPGVVAAAMRG
jgi:acyl-CoA reductase-like NAD-dependent aldehyde dehydrogenase